MVHSSPERDGRTTARTRVPPERQPLRPATALAVLSLLTVLLEVAGAVLVVVAARTGLLEDVVRDMDPEGPGSVAWIVMLVLGVLGVVVVGFGLRLASVVLGILVVIRGDGKLRIGASVLLAIALFGMFFSLTIEGPALSGGIEAAFAVLQWTVEIFRWALTITGLVLLGLGIGEVRRARAAQLPGLR